MNDLIHAFGIDWKLIIVQSVNFLVMLGILSYFVYGPVMRMLRERAAKVAQGLTDAEVARKDREAVSAERSGIIAEAQHEAEKIVARAQDEGKTERNTIVKSAQDRAQQIVKDGELAADEERRRALKESEAEVARAAVLAAEKILRQNV